METLKPLEEVAEPDERNYYFLAIGAGGEAASLSLPDVHAAVADCALHVGVPERVRTHFAQAQNLAVYSWFYYPFNVTAQLMGFASLEFALRLRTGKKFGLKRLIAHAVEEKWIRDEGFAVARMRERTDERPYVEVLVEAIPSLRNRLAHGSSMLHNNGISSLRICSEFINQLYAVPRN